MTKKIFSLCFLGALCSLGTSLFCNNYPVVVISRFNAKDIAEDDVDFVMDTFTTNFASLSVANIVDRSSFDIIKKELSFQDSDWSDNNKVAEMGRALNASNVVVGQLTKRSGKIFLTVKILDVNTTTIIASHMLRVNNIDNFFDVMSSFCEELIKKSGDSLSTSSAKPSKTSGATKNILTTTSNASPKSEDRAKTAVDTSQFSNAKYKIGDVGPYGGIIFYVSEEGFKIYDEKGNFEVCHYFEATSVIGKSRWGYATIKDLENELGYGKANTHKILNALPNSELTSKSCATYRAYYYHTARNEASGTWWLPSKDELELVYKNLYKGKDIKDVEWCWSSSLNGTAQYAWVKDFVSGTNRIYDKGIAQSVIAVRAF